MVVQLGEVRGEGMPDSECPVPAWQRQPTRVTFAAKQKTDERFTCAVRGHTVSFLKENSEDEAEEWKAAFKNATRIIALVLD
jgi:hypothetical protein